MNRLFVTFLILCITLGLKAQSVVDISLNDSTGAIKTIKLSEDKYAMNWILDTDGTQYPWITQKYGWGLGYFTQTKEHESIKREWYKPVEKSNNGMNIVYQEGDIRISVERKYDGNKLIEKYILKNIGHDEVSIKDIGIYTPFNDNYPNAKECLTRRTNVHIWDGGSAAYVNALRMGSEAPHLGLVVTEGSIKSYEIWERGRNRGSSHTRGVIALNLPDLYLKIGESYILEWILFSHNGNDDFKSKLLEQGSVIVNSDKYVYEKGEDVKVRLKSSKKLSSCEAKMNGVPVAVKEEGLNYVIEETVYQPGEVRFEFIYDNKKTTYADCLVLSDIDELISRRVDFISNKQQMKDIKDLRYGAFMVYDNEGDSIYLNNTKNCNPVDRDEGAERLGMGILLAKHYRLSPSSDLKKSLLEYADFVRNKLQTKDFVTYSSVDQKGRNRGYNYMWVATFYFQMYYVTDDVKYAKFGYNTMQALYKQFGYGFYSIETPVCLALQVLRQSGLYDEYEDLKRDLINTGDIYVENGLNYPKHEVNYEQSIVAPAVMFLLQLYKETGNLKYLESAKVQLPVLQAFSGFQPSFHLNEIGIRHWDGHWFGKRELFGDTFPHYWSAITAAVYHYYSICMDYDEYRAKAENIVRNNLCLFSEDGRGSCAYLYPNRINGIKGKFYDPYANDQDWALVYYYFIKYGI